SHLDFRGRRCGRAVVIEASGVGLGDVMVLQAADHDLLLPTERSADFNFVTGPNGTIGLCALAVYGNLPAPARFLSLRSRAKETGDIKPDIEPQRVDGAHVSNSCTTREFC